MVTNLAILLLFIFGMTNQSVGDSPFREPQWQFREFHAPAELSHEEIWDIEQAKDGSVWFATGGGGITQIKDGYKTVYDQQSGLCNNYVRCVAEDRFSGMWVGTSAGINYIYKNTITTFTASNTQEIPNDSIIDIGIDPKGDIWFSADTFKIFYFSLTSIENDKPKGEWQRPPNHPTGDQQIKKIRFTPDNTFWSAINYGGVGVWPRNGQFQRLFWNPRINACYDICFDRNNNTWACGATDLACYNQDKILKKKIRTPYNLSALAEYNGVILVGTYADGLFYLDGEELKPIPISREHQTPYIECIRPTSDGSIWIGTREGACHISKSSWQATTTLPNGAMPLSRTLTKANDGALYMMDIAQNLYCNREGEWEKMATLSTPKISPEKRGAYFLLAGNNNDLYYRHLDKIFHILLNVPVQTETMPLPPSFSNFDDISCFYMDNNSQLWFLDHVGAYRWENQQWIAFPSTCKRKKEHSLKNQVFKMFSPSQNVMWFLGRGWIDEWKNNQFSSIVLPKSYTDYTDQWSKVYDTVRYDNTFWFATDRNGLLRFDGNNWQHFHHKDGLPSEGLYSLYTSDNTLWAGSLRTGLSSLKDGRWITYGFKDGLLNGQVDQFAMDSTGKLWVLLQYAGMVSYIPEKTPPIVWMNSVTENMIPGESGVFTFDGRDVWNQTEYEEMVFSWRIINEKTNKNIQDWTPYQPVRTVKTPRMSPGTYRLEVLSQDKDRNISLQPATSTFIVHPHFWMTAYFQIPVNLMLLFALIALGIWYTKHQALQQSETRYRNLVEKDSLTLILNWNLDGTILYCNENIENYFGTPSTQIIGLPIGQFLGFEESEQFEIFQNTITGAMENPDEPHSCRLRIEIDQRSCWISWFFRCVTEGNKTTPDIHAFGVDITQQVQNEITLLQERMSVKEFFDSAQIGVFHINFKNHVTYVNPAMRSIAGIPKPVTENDSEDISITWLNPSQFNDFTELIRTQNIPASITLEGYRVDNQERFHILLSGINKEDFIEFMVLDFTEQKNLEKKIALSSMREQDRLGRELHDGLCQQLVAVSYLASILKKKYEKESNDSIELLNDICTQIDLSIQQARNISKGLRPITIKQGGLRLAIHELADSYYTIYRIPIVVEIDDFEPFADTDIANGLYRIIREASFNALKHAQASMIRIYSFDQNDLIGIAIADNGRGISSSKDALPKSGMGLGLMNYQAGSIGATISIESAPDAGTIVTCSLCKENYDTPDLCRENGLYSR